MFHRPRTTAIVSGVALSLLSACGGGDQGDSAGAGATSAGEAAPAAAASPTGASAAGTANSADANIFATMTAANAAEIAAAQLAIDSASNADVKRFAQRMLTDHQAMNEQGHQLAQQLNVPSQPGSATQTVGQQSEEIGQQLHGKKGKEFDVAFMDAMVRSHESTLQLLDQSANTTNTPQLDQHIAQARTKVQSHLDEAKQIQQKLGTS